MLSQKEYRKEILLTLNKAQLSLPPNWVELPTLHAGGLTDIGFSRDSKHILVISTAGRGLFESSTGNKVARDSNINDYEWFDKAENQAQGIGELAHLMFRVAGLNGGTLQLTDSNQIKVVIAYPHWPEEDIYLCPIDKHLLSEPEFCHKVASDYFRTAGFSYSGEYFLHACSSSFTILRNTKFEHSELPHSI